MPLEKEKYVLWEIRKTSAPQDSVDWHMPKRSTSNSARHSKLSKYVESSVTANSSDQWFPYSYLKDYLLLHRKFIYISFALHAAHPYVQILDLGIGHSAV